MVLDDKCPKCGADLCEKTGAHGVFLSCSTFPECKYTRSLRSKKPKKDDAAKAPEVIAHALEYLTRCERSFDRARAGLDALEKICNTFPGNGGEE